MNTLPTTKEEAEACLYDAYCRNNIVEMSHQELLCVIKALEITGFNDIDDYIMAPDSSY